MRNADASVTPGAPGGPAERRTRAVVVGLGGADRGDDAVGPAVVQAVGELGIADVRVVVHEDPTALIDVWAGAELAVVVDAVVSGRDPGTLHVIETGAGGPALPDSAWSGTGRGGTHAFGLAASIELARALRRLPPRLVVIGVEGEHFEHGATLSAKVAAAVPRATAQVLATLTGAEVTSAADPARRHTEEVAHVPR